MESLERKFIINEMISTFKYQMHKRGKEVTDTKILREFANVLLDEYDFLQEPLLDFYNEDLASVIDFDNEDCISIEDLERQEYINNVLKPQINDLNNR